MSDTVIPVQVPALDPASTPIVERYHQVWTPTIMLLSPEGDASYEWNGYLPPQPYLAQLGLGLGKAALKEDRFEDAARHFDRVAAEHADTEDAAEAMYWAAVARYKGSGQVDDLVGGWQKLRERYPDSPWRTRQSFMEG